MPQQSAALAQIDPGDVHARQVPAVHPRPLEHALPAQHACPDAPQVLMGAAQRPDWHKAVPAQTLPVQQG